MKGLDVVYVRVRLFCEIIQGLLQGLFEGDSGVIIRVIYPSLEQVLPSE